MSITRIRRAATSLALTLTIAAAGAAATAAPAGASELKPAPRAERPAAPAGAMRAGTKTATRKSTRRARQARPLRRTAVGRTTGLVRPPSGVFRGCTNAYVASGMWVSTCWWSTEYSSAPAGAHLIGWATETRWYHETYYLGVDGRWHFWYAG